MRIIEFKEPKRKGSGGMEENKWESGQASQGQLPPLQVPDGDGEDWEQAQDVREDIWTPQAPRRRVQLWQVLLAVAAAIFAVRSRAGSTTTAWRLSPMWILT